jgi:hypothetical protein
MSPFVADIDAKAFSARRPKILRAAGALYAATRGTISFHPKSITGHRSGADKRCSSRENIGTFETCQSALTMSGVGGDKAEVTWTSLNRSF